MLKLEANWKYVADSVMGGVSNGHITTQIVDGRSAIRLTGMVSLENNGGFIQMATDLKQDGSSLDATNWTGIEIDICGNEEIYDLRIRTDDLDRPWHSFRAPFLATAQWTTVRFSFAVFEPHRTDQGLAPAKLRRIGIVAVGRVFQADIAVSGVRLF